MTFQEYSQPVWRTAVKSSWQEAVSQHFFLLPRSKVTWAQCVCSVLHHIVPTMKYMDVRRTWTPLRFSLNFFKLWLLALKVCGEEEGRNNKSFLILSLGHMGSNKAPNSVLSVIQKCCVFHRALHWKHASNTQPTQEKIGLEVAGGGEELDSFNSICVFHIARMLFVHITQCTSGTHNKSLSATLGKVKTDKLKICRLIYVSPLISSMLLHIWFTFRVHVVHRVSQYSNYTLTTTVV